MFYVKKWSGYTELMEMDILHYSYSGNKRNFLEYKISLALY